MRLLDKRILGYTALLALAAMLLPVGGCGSEGADLLNNPRPTVPDVPLPTGFSLEELRSRSWADGDLRFVDHLYEGSADKMAAVRFFETQMPVSHWTAQTKQITQGRATLDFAKNNEKCRITIYDTGFLGSTYIQIAIWPNRSGSHRKK